ncbi:MAG: single-stranded DNA-binding protein [Candidatus Hydrogenedentes bacterium]|nr:single-stranded DNA-binding protein [Candidatus Hydrogenedentota bacterium]
MSPSEQLLAASARLRDATGAMCFPSPITHVYNPLDYAWAPHANYIARYGCSTKEVVLLGMNPGPWGMAQTGVPFGEVGLVRDWLGIRGEVRKPAREHPERPVEGFACMRSEVSGARLWGWARDRFGSPEAFFARFYVHNYCPLSFMEAGGKNFTPDKLPAAARETLFEACDAALAELVAALQPRYLLGVGGFAEQRIKKALPDWEGVCGRILHPSPASPAANRGWAAQAEAGMRRYGVAL